MINNTVSRTCVAVRSLDGGQHITDLSTVVAIIRPRKQIPFGTCEPCEGSVDTWGCNEPVLGRNDLTLDPSWLTYPAHDFNEDKTRICFHWDEVLWARPPGRYMATVYLCGVAIGCFQMQVGKRFVADDPINAAFNPCEADVAICAPTVVICTALPAAGPIQSIAWYENVLIGTGLLAVGNVGAIFASAVVASNVYYGGVVGGARTGAAVAVQSTWAPLAWGAFNLAAQVAPLVTINAAGRIAVAPQRVIGGTINQMSHGTVRITASVDSTQLHNTLILALTDNDSPQVAWTIELT